MKQTKPKPKPKPRPQLKPTEHLISYIGVQKVSPRRWVHIGFDEATKTVVPMPPHLIPHDPEPKHP